MINYNLYYLIILKDLFNLCKLKRSLSLKQNYNISKILINFTFLYIEICFKNIIRK